MKIRKSEQGGQPVMVAFPMKNKRNGWVLRLTRDVTNLEILKDDILVGFQNKQKGDKTIIRFYPPIKKAGK